MSAGCALPCWLVVASATLVGGVAAPARARDTVDYRRQWLAETNALRREDVRVCRVVRDRGERFGRLAFRSVAPTCAAYFVSARQIAASLEDVRLFLPLPELGLERACHQAGWLYGFVHEHQTVWPRCEAELSAARREALAARLSACRAVADMVKADSESLLQFLRSRAGSRADAELAALRRKMVALVTLGRSQEAWQALLAAERTEDLSSLPCQIVIGTALAEGG